MVVMIRGVLEYRKYEVADMESSLCNGKLKIDISKNGKWDVQKKSRFIELHLRLFFFLFCHFFFFWRTFGKVVGLQGANGTSDETYDTMQNVLDSIMFFLL